MEKNTNPKTAAAILVEAAAAAKTGNAPSLDSLNAALAEADARGTKKKQTVMLAGISPGTWGLLASDGPLATGNATPGHRRFFKGLLPRLPASDAAKVRAILAHYKVTL